MFKNAPECFAQKSIIAKVSLIIETTFVEAFEQVPNPAASLSAPCFHNFTTFRIVVPSTKFSDRAPEHATWISRIYFLVSILL